VQGGRTVAAGAPGFSWPGREQGARAPEPGEIPLSPSEVIVGIRRGWIGKRMTPWQRAEAIEALSDDATLPVVQVLVPADDWAGEGHVPAHPGIWGGLL
jgi:hypothetical protein